MRWPIYFILAYVAIGMQVGIARSLDVWGVPPNFVLMAVVFIALNAPREAALLGGLGLGLMQDLLSAGHLGIYALSYGLFGLIAAGHGNAAIRGNAFVHFLLTLVGGFITAMVIVIHGWLPFTHGSREPFWPMMWSAVYSALLAPLLLGVLQRARKFFSFEPSRRRMRLR